MSGLFDIERLIGLLAQSGHAISGFERIPRRRIILRHDVDISLSAAARFATALADRRLAGTYFVRLRALSYNPGAADSIRDLRRIATAGGRFGLHWEVQSSDEPSDEPSAISQVSAEHARLRGILPDDLDLSDVVSVHRPPTWAIGMPFDAPFVNAYAAPFFGADAVYQSDSNGVFDWERFAVNLKSRDWQTFQLLIHPEWWILSAAERADVYETLVREHRQNLGKWLSHEIQAFEDLSSLNSRT